MDLVARAIRGARSRDSFLNGLLRTRFLPSWVGRPRAKAIWASVNRFCRIRLLRNAKDLPGGAPPRRWARRLGRPHRPPSESSTRPPRGNRRSAGAHGAHPLGSHSLIGTEPRAIHRFSRSIDPPGRPPQLPIDRHDVPLDRYAGGCILETPVEDGFEPSPPIGN